MVTYNKELPSIKLHGPLIEWSSDLISLIQFAGLERKRLSRHRLLAYIHSESFTQKKKKKPFIYFRS